MIPMMMWGRLTGIIEIMLIKVIMVSWIIGYSWVDNWAWDIGYCNVDLEHEDKACKRIGPWINWMLKAFHSNI